MSYYTIVYIYNLSLLYSAFGTRSRSPPHCPASRIQHHITPHRTRTSVFQQLHIDDTSFSFPLPVLPLVMYSCNANGIETG